MVEPTAAVQKPAVTALQPFPAPGLLNPNAQPFAGGGQMDIMNALRQQALEMQRQKDQASPPLPQVSSPALTSAGNLVGILMRHQHTHE